MKFIYIHMWQSRVEIEYCSVTYLSASPSLTSYSAELPLRVGLMGRTKLITSGAHDIIAVTSPQKNDLCTEEVGDKSHWMRLVYHLEKLHSVVYFVGRS